MPEITTEDLAAMIDKSVSTAVATLEIPKQMSKEEIVDTVKSTMVEVIGDNDRRREDQNTVTANSEDLKRLSREERILAFGRVVRGMAAAKADGVKPIEALKRFGDGEDSPAVKLLVIGTPTSGGYLNPEVVSDDFIELLRPHSVVRSAGPIEVPMPMGNLTLNGMASGSTAAYIGEMDKIAASGVTFRQVKLSAKKLVGLVPLSNEVMRMTHPKADSIVVKDMLAVAATRQDLAFLSGDGTNDTPIGFLNMSGIGTNASAGTTLANIRTDIGKSRLSLRQACMPMKKVVRFISPRSEYGLSIIADGVGKLVYKEEMNSGKLDGQPFDVSEQIPENLGVGTDESYVLTVDMNQVIIGDTHGPEIAISDSASYADNEATPVVRSAFQHDMTLIRMTTSHDIDIRHDKAVHSLTAVQWGQ